MSHRPCQTARAIGAFIVIAVLAAGCAATNDRIEVNGAARSTIDSSTESQSETTADRASATSKVAATAPAETSPVVESSTRPGTVAPPPASPPTTQPTSAIVTLPVLTVPPPTEPVLTSAAPTTASLVEGDLGLVVPITRPPCDGSYITIIGSTVTPGKYEAQTSALLNRYNGSSYLLTEATCSSLRARLDGNQIYSVYYGPFATLQDACSARRFGPRDAYVKTLDNNPPSNVALGC